MINFSAGVILQPPIKPSSVPQGIPIQHLKDGFQFQIHQTHGNFYWNFLTGHISHHNPQKPSEIHGISRFLWDFHGISMGFPWDFHGISRFLCPPWKRQETTAPMSQAERGNMEPTRWASVSCSTAKEVTPPSSEISEMGCPMMPPKWRAKRNPTTQQPTSGFLYFFCWVNVDSK